MTLRDVRYTCACGEVAIPGKNKCALCNSPLLAKIPPRYKLVAVAVLFFIGLIWGIVYGSVALVNLVNAVDTVSSSSHFQGVR